MSEDRAALAEIRDYDDLVAAANARMAELGITFATLDAVSGVQEGYSAKLLGAICERKRMKHFGPMSFGAIFGALRVKFVMVEDPNATKNLAARLQKRRYRGKMLRMASIPWLFTPLTARKLNEMRQKKLGSKRRRAIARHAAVVRWDRVKAAVASRARGSRPGA